MNDQISTVIGDIESFESHCEMDGYTDTGDAWELLSRAREVLEKVAPSPQDGAITYSGVASNTASASRMADLRATTGSGSPSASRSPS